MNFETVFMYIGMVVSIATILVTAFDKIAKITPSTKDDVLAGKLTKGLAVVVSILDKFSVAPTSDKK